MPLRFIDIFPFHHSTVAKHQAGGDSEHGVGLIFMYIKIKAYYNQSRICSYYTVHRHFRI